jgi:hypothetical protein
VLNPTTIALSFDGATVTPTSVTKNGATTTITVQCSQLPASLRLQSHDRPDPPGQRGVSFTSNSSFVVPAYATLPTAAGFPASAVDKTKIGLPHQNLPGRRRYPGRNHRLQRSPPRRFNTGPMSPTSSDAGGVDANGYFTWTSYINFDTTLGANGYFNDPDFVTSLFPGIPGTPETTGPDENFVQEILAALEFTQPGMYTMAVNTDWTGFPMAPTAIWSVSAPIPWTRLPAFAWDSLMPSPRRPRSRCRQFARSSSTSRRRAFTPSDSCTTRAAGTANLEWFILNADGTRTLINDTGGVPAYYAWTAPPAAPTLGVARTATGLTLTFTGRLQSANSLTGPWTDVAGNSPLTVSASDPAKFYRAAQ